MTTSNNKPDQDEADEGAFRHKPLQPSRELAAVVGAAPLANRALLPKGFARPQVPWHHECALDHSLSRFRSGAGISPSP